MIRGCSDCRDIHCWISTNWRINQSCFLLPKLMFSTKPCHFSFPKVFPSLFLISSGTKVMTQLLLYRKTRMYALHNRIVSNAFFRWQLRAKFCLPTHKIPYGRNDSGKITLATAVRFPQIRNPKQKTMCFALGLWLLRVQGAALDTEGPRIETCGPPRKFTKFAQSLTPYFLNVSGSLSSNSLRLISSEEKVKGRHHTPR